MTANIPGVRLAPVVPSRHDAKSSHQRQLRRSIHTNSLCGGDYVSPEPGIQGAEADELMRLLLRKRGGAAGTMSGVRVSPQRSVWKCGGCRSHDDAHSLVTGNAGQKTFVMSKSGEEASII
jgi:hypothetical protein